MQKQYELKQHYKKSPQWTIPNLTGRIRTMDRLWTMLWILSRRRTLWKLEK